MAAQHLTADEALEFDQLAAAPERVEIHGNDRLWIHTVLASVLSAACITFAPIDAARAGPTAAATPQARQSQIAAGTALAINDREAMRLAQSVGADRVARTTSPTMRVHLNVLGFAAGSPAEVDQQAREAVFARNSYGKGPGTQPMLVGARVGGEEGRLQAYEAVSSAMADRESPASASYLAEGGNDRAACVITISDLHLPAMKHMAQATTLRPVQVREMMLLHEAAHCAQNAEKLAAMNDWHTTGKVLGRRMGSGMLGARFESDLTQAMAEPEGGGAGRRLLDAGYFARPDQTLSNERYAAGYSTVAMLARGSLLPVEVPRVVAFLDSLAPGHNVSEFVQWLSSQALSGTALQKMQASGGRDFDAAAVARWVVPRWNSFERSELRPDGLTHRMTIAPAEGAGLEDLHRQLAAASKASGKAAESALNRILSRAGRKHDYQPDVDDTPKG